MRMHARRQRGCSVKGWLAPGPLGSLLHGGRLPRGVCGHSDPRMWTVSPEGVILRAVSLG